MNYYLTINLLYLLGAQIVLNIPSYINSKPVAWNLLSTVLCLFNKSIKVVKLYKGFYTIYI